MGNLISTFDRFTTSFASGILLMFGFYAIMDAIQPGMAYWTINSFINDSTARFAFGLPLLFATYIIGAVNVFMADMLFRNWFRRYTNDLKILDRIESRNHPLLSKELEDMICLKRLLIGCALPLICIGLALPFVTSGRDHARFYPPYVAVGILVTVMALASPFLAGYVYKAMTDLEKTLTGRT